MDEKLIGIISAIISMVSAMIFLFWGLLFNGWNIAWIVFIPCGIAIAIVSMIGKYTREKKEEQGEKE